MPRPPRPLLPELETDRDPLVRRAVVAALPTADRASLDGLVPLLLASDDAEALAAVVTHFHRLSGAMRRRVVGEAERLSRPLRQVGDRHHAPPPSQPGRNVVAILRASGSPKLAYLLAEQLRHPDPAVRDAAAEGLFQSSSDATPAERAGHDPILEALARAAALYRHHQHPLVLRALLRRLPASFDTLATLLTDPGGHPARAVQAMLEHDAPPPEAERAALTLLELDGTRDVAVALLERRLRDGGACPGMQERHALLLPRPQRVLRHAAADRRLLPPAWAWSMPAPASRGLPALILQTGDSPDAMADRLARLAPHPDPLTRLSAARALIALDAAEAEGVSLLHLHTFAKDREAAVAGVALRWLRRRRNLPESLLRIVAGDEHAGGRGLAAAWLADGAFHRLWREWDELDDPQRATLRPVVRVHGRAQRLLAERLHAPLPAVRSRAAAMLVSLQPHDAPAGVAA